MAEMVQASHTLQVATRGNGFVEITGQRVDAIVMLNGPGDRLHQFPEEVVEVG